jgi:hypothetical protein
MPPAAPQYTPSQVLEAGRRAEAEGRIDYAVQFYRHLTDHHASAPEAEAAHDALTVIYARRAGEPAPAPAINGAQFRTGPPPVPAQARSAPQVPPAIAIAPLDAERLLPLILPEPQNAYRTGRILARLLTWAGGTVALAGLVTLPLLLLAPHVLAAVPWAGDWLSLPILAPAALAGGVLAMLLGQLVRAVLDQANATCDLAATERAQAEHRAGAWQPLL